MLIVSLVPVLVSRLFVKIIYPMPSSRYFDQFIRSVGGLSTDPLCETHDLFQMLILGAEKIRAFERGSACPLSGLAPTPIIIPSDYCLQPHQVTLPTQP